MSAPPAFCRCAGGRAPRSEGHKDLHRRPRAGGRQRSRRRSRRDRHLRRSIRRGGPIQRSRGHGSVLGLLAAPAPRTSSGRPIGIGTSLSSVARCRRRPNGRCRVRSIDDCAHWPQGARLGPRVRCGCARLDDRWGGPSPAHGSSHSMRSARRSARWLHPGRPRRGSCRPRWRAPGSLIWSRPRACGLSRAPRGLCTRSAALRRLLSLRCRWTSGRGPTGLRRLSGSGRSPSGLRAPGCVGGPVSSARWSLLVWRPLWWGCWRSSLLSCRVSPQTAGRRRAWPSEPSSAPRRSGHSWWSWR